MKDDSCGSAYNTVSNENRLDVDDDGTPINTANDGLSNTDKAADHVSSAMAARVQPTHGNKANPTAALINHFSSIYKLKR